MRGFLKSFFASALLNRMTQLFVGSVMLLIIFLYYRTELTPFEYQNYDNLVSLFQKYDAELDEGIAQTRFGLVLHYDSVNEALMGMHHVTREFEKSLKINHAPQSLQHKLFELNKTLNNKDRLTQNFKRINPVLKNAIQDFSSLMGRIIEAEAHLELIESCFEQVYRYELIDKVNTLFRGVLVYVSAPDDEKREKMIMLMNDIKKESESLPNLDKALIYAEVVLSQQPILNDINTQLLAVPVLQKLDDLDHAFELAYLQYNNKLDKYRFFLYAVSILLLIVLHFAFKRLQDMVSRLQVEIELKNKAQGELAAINEELEQRVHDRTHDLAKKNEDLNEALSDLKEAQDQLIMQEKMASVGMLTTGVAHEIKNPLNFINNFSDISIDLVEELKEELDKQKDKLGKDAASYIDEVLNDVKTNVSKIHQHGQRADNIVKNMLLHSQEAGVQKEMTNINELLEDNINIAYQSQKAANEKFECDIEIDFDKTIDMTLVAPQAMTRVFTYLIHNSFYAVSEKSLKEKDYKPLVKVSTIKEGDWILIRFYDNGIGIPEKDFKKIFEPFYTTKPTGQGSTGLGLSICYDTVVKQHKGDISVDSKLGEYTVMTVKLPIVKSRSLR